MRAVLAIGALASAIYRWSIGEAVADEHLALVALVNGYYFGARSSEPSPPPPVEEVEIEEAPPLPEPRRGIKA